MNRGDVYLVRMRLPDRERGTGSTYRDKYVVVLQGGKHFSSCTEVCIAIASTYRGSSVRPFEVKVGRADGFHHDTVIDCRWLFTLPRAEIVSGDYKFTLSEARMHDVSLALVHGLQLG